MSFGLSLTVIDLSQFVMACLVLTVLRIKTG